MAERSISEGLEEEMAALVSDLRTVRTRLLNLERDLGELVRQAQIKLDEADRVSSVLKSAVEDLEGRIREAGEAQDRARSLLGDVDGLLAEASARLGSAEASFRDRLDGMLREASSAVDALLGEGRRVLSALREEGEEELGRLRRGLEEAAGVLRGEVEQTFVALRKSHEAAVASLEQDLRARVENASFSLRAEVGKALERIEVYRGEVRQAREAVDGLQAASLQRVKATEEMVRGMKEVLGRAQVEVLGALLASGVAMVLALWSVWFR